MRAIPWWKILFFSLLVKQISGKNATCIFVTEDDFVVDFEKQSILKWQETENNGISFQNVHLNSSVFQSISTGQLLDGADLLVSFTGTSLSQWLTSRFAINKHPPLISSSRFQELPLKSVSYLIKKNKWFHVLIISDTDQRPFLIHLSRNGIYCRILYFPEMLTDESFQQNVIGSEVIVVMCGYSCAYRITLQAFRLGLMSNLLPWIYICNEFSNIWPNITIRLQEGTFGNIFIITLSLQLRWDLRSPQEHSTRLNSRTENNFTCTKEWISESTPIQVAFHIRTHHFQKVSSNSAFRTTAVAMDDSDICPIILEPNHTYDLQGITLRFGIFNDPPFTGMNFSHSDNSIVATYFLGDVLKRIQQSLQFKEEFVQAEEYIYGSLLPNSSWDGIIGMLLRKEIDVSAIILSKTLERTDVVDFSVHVYSFSYSVVIRNPYFHESEKFSNYFKIYTSSFELKLWFCIFLLSVSTALLFSFTQLVFTTSQEQAGNNTAVAYLFITCCQLLHQGTIFPRLKKSSMIIILSFLFFCVMITSSYQSTLTSILTVQESKVPFQTIEDLMKADYQFGILRSVNIFEELKNSRRGLNLKLWHKIKSNPGNLVSTVQEGLSKVLHEKYAFVMVTEILQPMLNGNCSYFFLPTNYFPGNGHLSFQKGSPLTEIFNQQIHKLRETGILPKFVQIHISQSLMVCYPKVINSGGMKCCVAPLIALLIGSTLAGIVGVIEELIWRKKAIASDLKL